MAHRPAIRDHPDDSRKPAFEFCFAGRLVSAQAANRILLQAWKTKIAAAAHAEW